LYEGANCENYAIWFFVVVSFIFVIVAPLSFLGVKKMHRERVKHVRRLRRDKRKVRHSAAVAIRVKRYQRNDSNQPPPTPSDNSLVKPPSNEAEGLRRPLPRARAVDLKSSVESGIDESDDDIRGPPAVTVPTAPENLPAKVVRRAKATIVSREVDSDD
jgi:hypothetical protein